ncbi:MAG TPA: hypothetical protein VFQ53_41660 [Kofleriaceae bacterium]|nr:hypothetical protein [Kofleriaceae bacterium]
MGPQRTDDARLHELVRRIERVPDDAQAWLGLAAELAQYGDVRGELIRRWHAEHDFDRFVAAHARQIFDDAAGAIALSWHDDRPLILSWSMGTVAWITARLWTEPRATMPALQRLLARPVCQFVRGLRVAFLDGGWTSGFDELFRPAYAHNLRQLEIGAWHDRDETVPAPLDVDWGRLCLYRLPALQTLDLAGRFSIGGFASATLRHVRLHADNLVSADFLALGRWSVPALQRLDLHLGHSTASPGALDAWLASPGFGALRTLGIHDCAFPAQLIEALAHSPLLPKLRILILQNTDLDDASLALLAQFHDRFRHLEQLRLGEDAERTESLRVVGLPIQLADGSLVSPLP